MRVQSWADPTPSKGPRQGPSVPMQPCPRVPTYVPTFLCKQQWSQSWSTHFILVTLAKTLFPPSPSMAGVTTWMCFLGHSMGAQLCSSGQLVQLGTVTG